MSARGIEMKQAAARIELTTNGIEYTRKDYMNGIVNHQTYYGQFVNDSITQLVLSRIGKNKILASTDESFNDIPLAKWDGLSVSVPSRMISLSNLFCQADDTQPSVSLSDKVCILKAAARMIRDAK